MKEHFDSQMRQRESEQSCQVNREPVAHKRISSTRSRNYEEMRSIIVILFHLPTGLDEGLAATLAVLTAASVFMTLSTQTATDLMPINMVNAVSW